MAVSQTHYRFGSDSGTESTYSFLAAEDTAISFQAGITFLLRLCLQTSATENNMAPQFQCRRNGGTYQSITTSSSICKAVTTAVFANAANTTQRLSGTGTFETTSQGCTHDGLAGGAQMDIVFPGNAETVCALQLVPADVVAGDVIDFRIVRDTLVVLDGYTVTPTLTVLVYEGVLAPVVMRWKPGRAFAAALRTLYANVALEPGVLVVTTGWGAAPWGEFPWGQSDDALPLVWTIYRSRLRGWS